MNEDTKKALTIEELKKLSAEDLAQAAGGYTASKTRPTGQAHNS